MKEYSQSQREAAARVSALLTEWNLSSTQGAYNILLAEGLKAQARQMLKIHSDTARLAERLSDIAGDLTIHTKGRNIN
jgi:hypothetical protein